MRELGCRSLADGLGRDGVGTRLGRLEGVLDARVSLTLVEDRTLEPISEGLPTTGEG